MGRVRTKTVKKAARLVIEKYYPKLTLDFQVNKKICDEVAVIPSIPLRNKIAGYVTHLMKRISRGPVKGISLLLQEEERERRDNYVPDASILETMMDHFEIDEQTKDMLEGMIDISKLNVQIGNNTLPTYKDRKPTYQKKNY